MWNNNLRTKSNDQNESPENQINEIVNKIKNAMNESNYKELYRLINETYEIIKKSVKKPRERQPLDNSQVRKFYGKLMEIKEENDSKNIEKIMIKTKLLIDYSEKRGIIKSYVKKILEAPIDWGLENIEELSKNSSKRELILDVFQMIIVHLVKKE